MNYTTVALMNTNLLKYIIEIKLQLRNRMNVLYDIVKQ